MKLRIDMRILLVMCSLISAVVPAGADEPVGVLTRISSPIEAAFGVVLLPEKMLDVRPTDPRVLLHPLVGVGYVVPEQVAANPQALYGAFIRSVDGKVWSTSLKPLSNVRLQSDLPFCAEALPPATVLAGQVGMLQSLSQVREGRVRIARERFQIDLAKFSEERLEKLERGFGLIGEEPDLIAEVDDPFVLVERLTRVLHAVKTYAAYRARSSK